MEKECSAPHQRPEKGQVDRVRSLSTSSSSDSGSSSEAESPSEKVATQLASLQERVGTNVRATVAGFPIFLRCFNTAVCIVD